MKTFLKPLLFVSLIFTAQFSFADSNSPESYNKAGFYFGGQLFSYKHSIPAGTAFESSLNFLGLGAFIGYQFNPYVAIQADYNSFENKQDAAGAEGSFGVEEGADHYYLYGGDILAKGIYPVSKRFTLNGYAGFAVINENTYNQEYLFEPPVVNSNYTEVMPEIGVGISLYLFRYVSIDMNIFHIFQVNKIASITIIPALSLTVHL